MNTRYFFHGWAPILFGLLAISFSFQQPKIVVGAFVNPSFEDPRPRESASPQGWTSITPNSTPDIFPGAWNLQHKPKAGKTCIGLVTRQDGSTEDVGQELTFTLDQGQCYSFTVYLAHADKYVGFNQPARLRVWGGAKSGQKQVLLYSSPLIQHTDWRAYEINFSSPQNIRALIFEANFAPGASFKYNGNILLDHCSEIVKCTRA